VYIYCVKVKVFGNSLKDFPMTNAVKFATGAFLLGLLSSSAHATETITYTYDARGRLVKVVHTGTVNNNNQACYKYDKADNRTTVQVNVGSLPACP
jgi:YD repeat-containing protein